jgi:hypothetical protein
MCADIVLGIVTILMALLGAAVSLHPPESLHAPGKWPVKVAYAASFFILGGIAVTFVIIQSNETAVTNQSLANALGDLRNSTADIASMTTLNTQLQERLLKQSDDIADLSKQNIAATTGGSTFCYVTANPVGAEFLLILSTIGKSPLHSITVEAYRCGQDANYCRGKTHSKF